MKVRFSPQSFLLLMMILVTFLAESLSPVGGLAQTAETGEIVGSDTSTIRNPGIGANDKSVLSAYTKPNQSRIWYNSFQDRWDALVPKFDSKQSFSQSNHYILKDVPGNQLFTSVGLEDRDFARPDCFWDDRNKKLYVLGSHPTESRFWRVGYNASTDRYSIEVGASTTGVPVPGITHPETSIGGNSAATLYVSPNGDIWVAVMKDNSGLEVQHSADGGATWMNNPITLNSSAKVGVTTWVHFKYLGNTYVGVFAGENGKIGGSFFYRRFIDQNTDFYFWFIDQNANPLVLTNWKNDSTNIPASFGDEKSDDHVSSARDANGNQYFAVKTEGGNPTDPLIKLYKRTPGGKWSQFKVTENQEVPEESRPSIVIDEENDMIYIYTNGAEVAGSEIRKAVRKKATRLEALEKLANAPFVTLFSGPKSVFTDIITPRQPVNEKSGIVVLAHNRTEEMVWFSAVEIESPVVLVTVPEVVGIPQAEADIVTADLTVGTVTTANSDTVPAGDVISQNPAAGTSVAIGSPVDLVVSLGPVPGDDDDDGNDDDD